MISPAANVPLRELVPATVRFECHRKHHRDVDEVRVETVRERADRRYRDGIRLVRSWSGYCAACGRRVPVSPAAA